PSRAIAPDSADVSSVGEWMNKSPPMRMTVMRVGNGIFGHGMPKRMIGPSTIQTSSQTGFSVLIGWYAPFAVPPMPSPFGGDGVAGLPQKRDDAFPAGQVQRSHGDESSSSVDERPGPRRHGAIACRHHRLLEFGKAGIALARRQGRPEEGPE